MPSGFLRSSWIVVLAVIAALSLSAPIQADLFSSVIKGAGKVAVVEGRHAAMLMAAGTRRATALTISEGGRMELVSFAAGTAAGAVAITNSDDLARALASISELVLLPAELATGRPKLVTEVLRLRKGETEVVDELGAAAGLSLAERAGHEALVVRMGEKITLSPQAWIQRGLLQQSLMRDLAARLRIIVLVDHTDLVQRRAFTARFGKKAVFVDSSGALGKALGNARERLVAIVGHVEGDRYVLRNAGNQVVVDEPISSIHRQIDEARSVALVLGCNVACMAQGSGPTTVIDALAVAEGLGRSANVNTPLQFLDGLAEVVGPLHVDTDMFGRLRAVSTGHVRGSDRLASGAGITTKVLLARTPTTPVTAGDIFAGAVTAILFIAYLLICLFLVGWISLFMMGMGPRTTWRETKENYAAFTGRPEEKIDTLLPWERPLLIVFGPVALLGQTALVLPLMGANIALALLSIPLTPFFLGPASRLLLADADMAIGTEWIGETFRRRIGATAIMVAGALATWLISVWVVPVLSTGGAAAAILAGLVLSWAILMKWSWLPGLWLLVSALPLILSIPLFLLVRFTAARLARLSFRRRSTA